MTYQLDDANGNWLQNLGDDYGRARKRAQEIANERGEAVSLYGGDVPSFKDEDGEWKDGREVYEPAL